VCNTREIRKPHPFNCFTAHRRQLFLVADVHAPRRGTVIRGITCVQGRKNSEPCAGKARGCVKRTTEIAVNDRELDCAEQLARFFPSVAAVRVPVQVSTLRGAGPKLREATVLEFAGAQHAIFLSTLPLEFEDRVRLERDSRGAVAEATVVAVQYHEGRKAVAVKFTQGLCDWMMQP
jgi:hypothetical protein